VAQRRHSGASGARASAERALRTEIKRSVVEDDKVRIEELRVRGQVKSITVSPKASGVRPYEIVPADAGRDASQNKGLSGQRLWQLFSF
jgi:hypothetical protein